MSIPEESVHEELGVSCAVCGEKTGHVTELAETVDPTAQMMWYAVWTPTTWAGELVLPPAHTLNGAARELLSLHEVFECLGARSVR